MTKIEAIEILERTTAQMKPCDLTSAIIMATDALKTQPDGCEGGACMIHYPEEKK